jgi:phage FluMu protein Com
MKFRSLSTEPSFQYLDTEAINVNLKCIIGNRSHPIYDPVQCLCGIPYCRSCMEPWVKVNRTCPQGKCKPFTMKDAQAVTLSLKSMLEELPVECSSCKKVVQRGNFDDHVTKSCPIPCPGCNDVITRSTKDKHLELECRQKPVTCPARNHYCGWIGKLEDLEAHVRACPVVMLRPAMEQQQKLISSLTAQVSELVVHKDQQQKTITSLKEQIANMVVDNGSPVSSSKSISSISWARSKYTPVKQQSQYGTYDIRSSMESTE